MSCSSLQEPELAVSSRNSKQIVQMKGVTWFGIIMTIIFIAMIFGCASYTCPTYSKTDFSKNKRSVAAAYEMRAVNPGKNHSHPKDR